MAYRPRKRAARPSTRRTTRKSSRPSSRRAVSRPRRQPARARSSGGVLKIVIEQRTSEPQLIGPTGHPMKTVEKRKGRF